MFKELCSRSFCSVEDKKSIFATSILQNRAKIQTIFQIRKIDEIFFFGSNYLYGKTSTY